MKIIGCTEVDKRSRDHHLSKTNKKASKEAR